MSTGFHRSWPSIDSPTPGVISERLAHGATTGPTVKEIQARSQPSRSHHICCAITYAICFISDSTKWLSVSPDHCRDCIVIKQRSTEDNQQIQARVVRLHLVPAAGWSITSMLCGDPTTTTAMCFQDQNQASPTRAKPPQIDRAAVRGCAFRGFQAKRNGAANITSSRVDIASRADA